MSARGGSDDGLIQDQIAGAAVEVSVTEREDTTISSHQPVSPAIRGGGDAHHGLIQGVTGHVP